MSCPNCGAHLDVSTFLAPPDPETYAPPQVYVDGHWVAAERWVVARCVGLDLPVLTSGGLALVSRPCGYFRWEHRVTRSFDADRAWTEHATAGTAFPSYAQPVVTPGQSFRTEDLTDEQRDHVERVARHVRETES
jgi:hypothetical protein